MLKRIFRLISLILLLVCAVSEISAQINTDSTTINLFISPIQSTTIVSDSTNTVENPFNESLDSLYNYSVFLNVNDTNDIGFVDVILWSDTTEIHHHQYGYDQQPNDANCSYNRIGNSLFLGIGDYPILSNYNVEVIIQDTAGLDHPTIYYSTTQE